MNYKEDVRQYVTEVWNYNRAVVEAFDDEDYKIVLNASAFQRWLAVKVLKESSYKLFEVVFVIPALTLINYIKGLIK